MTEPAPRVRLLLVDDHALFREGLARVLDAQPGFEVVARAATVAAALACLETATPDVVLLDVDLGGERALDFLRGVKPAASPKVLVVTAGVSDREAVQLVQEGVSGILHKHNQPETLCQAIRQVAAGEVYLEPRYLKPLFQTIDSSQSGTRPALTDREVRLLRHIFEGMANKEIAECLSLSESAVKAALRTLFQKVGVRTRSQLVKVALEQYRDQL